MKKIAYILITIAIVGFSIGGGYRVHADIGTDKYVPLAPLPIVNDGDAPVNIGKYAQGVFQLAIGLSAVAAIFMIIIGGIQYMSTDAISGKHDGKEKVKDALFGLMLVILSWIILSTINPKLVGLNLTLPAASTSGGSGGSTPQSQLQCNVAITSKELGTKYKDDNTAQGDRSACQGKVSVWQKVKYTTTNASAGRNGCYQDSAKNWCVDVFAGDPSQLMFIKTDCTANKDYSTCESKKNWWQDQNAFNASCNCT